MSSQAYRNQPARPISCELCEQTVHWIRGLGRDLVYVSEAGSGGYTLHASFWEFNPYTMSGANQRQMLRLLLLGGCTILLLATLYNSIDTTNTKRQQMITTIQTRNLQPRDFETELDAAPPRDNKNPGWMDTKILNSDVLMFDNITNIKNRGRARERDDPYWSPKNQLLPGLIPSSVHFFWCGKRWFEFKHYLSMQGVIRAIDPQRITVHFEEEPVVDRVFYHTWIKDLRRDFPHLYMEKLDGTLLDFCGLGRQQQIQLILATLNVDGGLYVGENTWLLRMDPQERLADLDFAIEPRTIDGYILMRKGMMEKGSVETIIASGAYKAKSSSCGTISQLYNGNDKAKCILVKNGKFNSFNPMDIWDLDDPFGRLSRKLFYGSEEIRKPIPTYDELVPNIGHMIWIGGGPMDYVFYLSALSMLYIMEVDMLYIHGDKEPAGEYWPKIKTNERVQFITQLPPVSIYQGPIEPWYRALMSDLIRVDLMIKYGGIYADTDAIWCKKLSHEDRGYEAVASFDWIDWSYPFPDSVNFGLSYGKRNAPFWRVFRDSMRELHNDSPGYTGVQMPYKLLEKYPHLLRIDRHLAAICYKSRCHPTWVEGYHNESRDHITTNSIPNFKEDLNALHWTHPNPPELKDEETLMKSTGMFAELGKYVLEKAGLLPKT